MKIQGRYIYPLCSIPYPRKQYKQARDSNFVRTCGRKYIKIGTIKDLKMTVIGNLAI